MALIDVAITGGGLAGVVLAAGLCSFPHLNVTLYESAPTLSERGASIAMGGNALRGLELISPSLRAAVDEAGGVYTQSTRLVIGQGPNTGEVVMDNFGSGKATVMSVHRARLLDEFLKHVPSEIIHTNRKLISIEESNNQGPTILQFQDGSTQKTDILIGADGIHSQVRKYILGADNPATPPVFAGWWDTRNLSPIDQAEKLMSPYINAADPRQYGWIGDGAFLIHTVLSHVQQAMVVASAYTDETWPEDSWKMPLELSKLQQTFQDWTIGENMVELLSSQPCLTAFSQWEHRDASTYFKGRVCMIGDAAHAMTPWQGNGAAQSIEDAMVLSYLLGRVASPSQIPAAMQGYDAVRRPRSQRVVQSSKGTGQILSGRSDAGLDPAKLRAALAGRWDFIFDADLAAEREAAYRIMQAVLRS